MTDLPGGPLGDDDMSTTFPGSGTFAAGDSDGTDGDGTDGTDGDGTDSDGTDGTDGDGTDGTDSDGTDGVAL